MELQGNMAQSIKRQEIAVGVILKRADGCSPDQCAVVIGWDEWLRPLVLHITLAPAAMPRLQILPFDEFTAEIGKDGVQALSEFETTSRRRPTPETLWPRVQALLKGGAMEDLQGLGSEAIARFVISGEGLGNALNNTHRMAA
jgi:hypothetical protein